MAFYVPSVPDGCAPAIPDGPDSVILGPRAGNLSHSIDDYPEGIVLPVDKPYRWTSADVIRKLKYAAIKHFGKKNLKVGHAGTLDPLATGVLLVCIGNACKKAQELQDHPKEYEALIRFGATTPSYDLEKNVDRTFPYNHITEDAVRAALPAFLGEQEQIAPLFSAKSVDGVRAYELARKLYKQSVISDGSGPVILGGSDSVIPGCSDPVIPGPRAGNLPDFDSAALETLQRNKITISELELLSFIPSAEEGRDSLSETCAPPHTGRGRGPLNTSSREAGTQEAMGGAGVERSGTEFSGRESLPSSASSRINVSETAGLGLPEARIRIACSKGTYIRAFARDLGEALGSGAHLGGLVRTRSGSFSLSDTLTVSQALELLAQ